MKAVVMAGGAGTRLRPLTARLPKPIAPICNRPILDHILGHLSRHGVDEAVLTLFYRAEDVMDQAGDGTDHGLTVIPVVETEPLGTAGSVKLAEEHLSGGTFCIVSGDALTDCDLTDALRFHKEKGSQATLVLSRVPDPSQFGIVITKEDGRIERFLEKPGWSEVFSDTVNTGIYILEPSVLEHIPDGTDFDWSKDVFPKMLEEGAPMYGYVTEGYWSDIGSIEQYARSQSDLMHRKANLPLPGDEVQPGIWTGEGTIIEDGAQITAPVCIGARARIKAGAKIGPNTVLGNDAIVSEGAEVRESSVWDGCYIGTDARIDHAIVCSRTTIKRSAHVMENAVVGERCLVDVGCTIRPGVKIWPDKTLERGSTVTMSLESGSRWRGTLFRDRGVAGISNIEITPEFVTRFGLAYATAMAPGNRVIVARDQSRSSRMTKRGLIASLVSAGCEVADMRLASVPVVRHHVSAIGAQGALLSRKDPGTSRLTLIEVLDQEGMAIPASAERQIETRFFREEFRRVDPDELGVINVSTRAADMYANDLHEALPDRGEGRIKRIAIDYGHAPVAPLVGSMLAKDGVQALTLNGTTDAKAAPRSREQIADHLANLSHIVASLGYDIGALFYGEGERVALVDDQGVPLNGTELLALASALAVEADGEGPVVLSVTAPLRLEKMLAERGAEVVRCRSTVRDMMSVAHQKGARFAGDDKGGLIFPGLTPGFDAILALGSILRLLDQQGRKASEIVASLPDFQVAYRAVSCSWDAKGRVMRRLAEADLNGARIELTDGIKVWRDDSWVLVLPDSFEPIIHIHAESDSAADSNALASEWEARIAELA